MRLAVLAVLVATLSACAARIAPPPATAAPQFPDFVFPAVSDPAQGSVVGEQQRAWQWLQAGDVRQAERGFSGILKRRPAFAPAESGLGYVALARRQHDEAIERFDRALQHLPNYAPALVGRAQALGALGRDAEALASYEAAAAADPFLDLGARIEVLRFRGAGDTVAEARRLAERGRLDQAREAYLKAIAASPDSAFLYRELGVLEERAGRPDQALTQWQKAMTLDPQDARVRVLAGDLLARTGRLDEAAAAYAAAEAIEPAPDTRRKLDEVQRQAELARLPPEYQAIASAPEVTRGDVAAVLGVRLGTRLPPAKGRQGVLLTDVRGHWASSWILAMVRSGIMDALPNHTFQPRQRVRRADLAQAVARVLNVLAAGRPAVAGWRNARLTLADVSPGHPAYPAVSQAVAAGVLPLEPGNTVVPGRIASGVELMSAVTRLEALFGPAGSSR